MNVFPDNTYSIALLILILMSLSLTVQLVRFGYITINLSGMKPITLTGQDAKLFGRTSLYTGLLSLGVMATQLLLQNDLGIVQYIPIPLHIANVAFLVVILLLRRIASTGDKLKRKPKDDELG